MPQNPIAVTTVPNPSLRSALHQTASAVLKVGKGVLGNVVVNVIGDTPGALYDTTTVAGAAVGNKITDVPNNKGPLPFNFPFFTGLVLIIGDAQDVSVSYQ